ncbi:hypothetical protein BC832DRAFT_398927 [Gaertneriomyces semiglobifer]|nr:hypothetical protein BC832DRAFT_398927 [Gaertneriomyces semiglobifer]
MRRFLNPISRRHQRQFVCNRLRTSTMETGELCFESRSPTPAFYCIHASLDPINFAVNLISEDILGHNALNVFVPTVIASCCCKCQSTFQDQYQRPFELSLRLSMNFHPQKSRKPQRIYTEKNRKLIHIFIRQALTDRQVDLSFPGTVAWASSFTFC